MAETSSQVFRLGAGSSATVYACTAWACVAVNQVADPARGAELACEHATHAALAAAWPPTPHGAAGRLAFHVPRCHELYTNFAAFRRGQRRAARRGERIPRTGRGVHHGARVARAAAAGAAQPPALLPGGVQARRSAVPGPHRLRARAARSSPQRQLLRPAEFSAPARLPGALGLPCERLAASVGAALGRLHFVAGFDGRGVQFVLGGAARHAAAEPALAVIGFSRVRRVPADGGGYAAVQQLAEAVMHDDSAVPRANSPWWHAFRAGYEGEAAHASALATAAAVLAALVARCWDAGRAADACRSVTSLLQRVGGAATCAYQSAMAGNCWGAPWCVTRAVCLRGTH